MSATSPCSSIVLGRVVAEIETALIGPVSPADVAPRRLSGFEFPALEAAEKAHRLAAERGIAKILVVDPLGQMPLARLGYGSGR